MSKYPKKHLIPPKSGPQPQGLNIQYNTVKTIPSEKINGRDRQNTSKHNDSAHTIARDLTSYSGHRNFKPKR